MQIICPKCEFMQDVPDEKIPPKAEKATCPKCGEKFKFRSVPKQEFQLEEESGDHSTQNTTTESDSGYSQESDQDDSIWSSLENIGQEEHSEGKQPPPPPGPGFEIPWENLNQFGFFPGFIETIKRAMLAPKAFFYRMPLKGLAMPLAFFLLISVTQALATFIWNMAGIFPTTAQHGSGEFGMGMMGLGSVFIIVIYPLFMGLWLFIASGVTHIFLTFFKAGNSGFEGTFRATAYGTAPMILSLLPFVGPVAGAAWSLVITIIGYKNIHETTFVRIIMAMLTPVLVLVIAAALLY